MIIKPLPDIADYDTYDEYLKYYRWWFSAMSSQSDPWWILPLLIVLGGAIGLIIYSA